MLSLTEIPSGIDPNLIGVQVYKVPLLGVRAFSGVTASELNRRVLLQKFPPSGDQLIDDLALNILTPEVLEARRILRGGQKDSNLQPDIKEIKKDSTPVRTGWKSALAAAGLVLVGGASAALSLIIDRDTVRAQDPAPVAGNQRERVNNYEVLVAKANTSGTGLIAAVRPPAETNSTIARLEENPQTGKLELNGSRKVSFTVQDGAISDDSETMVVVGSDNRRVLDGECKVDWTQDGGQTWRSVAQPDIQSRGVCLEVEVPTNNDIFIAQADRRAENYPAWLLRLDPDTGRLIDLSACPDCVASGSGSLEQLLGGFSITPAGQFVAYSSADPNFGYKRRIIDNTGVVSIAKLRPQVGYVMGEVKQYDYQGVHTVVTFHNFGRADNEPTEVVSGIMTKDRYSWNGNTFVFLNSTQDKTDTALYPQDTTKGFNLFLVVPDKLTDKIYKATLMGKLNRQTGNDTRTAFFEVAETNSLLPTDGDWISQRGDDSIIIKSGDIVTKGGRRLLIAGLTRDEFVYDEPTNTMNTKFSDGRMLAIDLAHLTPWEGIDLLAAPKIPDYKIYLPIAVNKQTSN